MRESDAEYVVTSPGCWQFPGSKSKEVLPGERTDGKARPGRRGGELRRQIGVQDAEGYGVRAGEVMLPEQPRGAVARQTPRSLPTQARSHGGDWPVTLGWLPSRGDSGPVWFTLWLRGT